MTATLGNRFVCKYMRQARQLGEDDNPCYSRHIGVVLVRVYDDGASKVLGTGYNGPPRSTPHCDSREYLEEIVWPQLTTEEKRFALTQVPESYRAAALLVEGDAVAQERHQRIVFQLSFQGCKTCPRRLVGAGSGERTELCSCEHAEKNAIANAACDLHGSWAFCWCGVACWDCAKLMVNAGIRRAYFIDDGGSDYSFGSRWLFRKKGLEITVRKPEEYLG